MNFWPPWRIEIRLVEFEKRLFTVSTRLDNRFCEICRYKVPLGRDQAYDSSTRQMALKIIMSFAKPKLQIQRGRKIVNLRVCLTLRYNILPLVKKKETFRRLRECDI
jgi:hypothetical protein